LVNWSIGQLVNWSIKLKEQSTKKRNTKKNFQNTFLNKKTIKNKQLKIERNIKNENK
jgi:hypothetical protein